MPPFYSEKNFFDAAQRGDIALVQQYMAHKPSDYNTHTRDERHNTPLHHAAIYGQLDMCLFLLALGADPNARNIDNYAPMALCMHANNAEKIVDALLNAGADLFIGDATTTALYAAVSADKPSIVKAFLDAGAKPHDAACLICAIKNDGASVVHMLLDHGADPAAKGEYNVTPLHFAAQLGMTEIAKRLIAGGADMDAHDLHNGNTPLHDAAQGSSADMVELLLTQGADATIRNDNGDTPLSLARKNNKPSVISAFKNFEPSQKSAEKPAQKKESPACKEQWVRMGQAEIARIRTYPALGSRLTEIFNFKNRERTVTSENLKTGEKTMDLPQRFEDIGGRAVQKAVEAFNKLGGHVEQATLAPQPDKAAAGKKPPSPPRPPQG